MSDPGHLYEEAALARPDMIPPVAAVTQAEEAMYQEVGPGGADDGEELYQDAVTPTQHTEPQKYEEEEYYQVRNFIIISRIVV